LQAGASADARDNDGDTTLMLATKSNARAMDKLLVEHGADMEISNNDGETAFLCAAEEGYMEIVNTC